MALKLDLQDGYVEIQRMTEYLLVIEHGCMSTLADVRRYTSGLEKERDAHQVRVMVVDARVDPTKTDPAARAAYWEWLETRPFERIAIVNDDEMLATELNMMALSRKMPVRAFTSLSEARAWAMKPIDDERVTQIPPEPTGH